MHSPGASRKPANLTCVSLPERDGKGKTIGSATLGWSSGPQSCPGHDQGVVIDFRKERPESRYGENWERRGLSQMRIDHLSLMNWRNFKTVDVSLGNRLFVVGPNASGKSNLLDALRFLRDVAN